MKIPIFSNLKLLSLIFIFKFRSTDNLQFLKNKKNKNFKIKKKDSFLCKFGKCALLIDRFFFQISVQNQISDQFFSAPTCSSPRKSGILSTRPPRLWRTFRKSCRTSNWTTSTWCWSIGRKGMPKTRDCFRRARTARWGTRMWTIWTLGRLWNRPRRLEKPDRLGCRTLIPSRFRWALFKAYHFISLSLIHIFTLNRVITGFLFLFFRFVFWPIETLLEGKIRLKFRALPNHWFFQRVWESAEIKPSCLQVELHPYFTQVKLREFCKEKGIVVVGYSPLGNPGSAFFRKDGDPNVLTNEVVAEIAKTKGKVSGHGKFQKNEKKNKLSFSVPFLYENSFWELSSFQKKIEKSVKKCFLVITAFCNYSNPKIFFTFEYHFLFRIFNKTFFEMPKFRKKRLKN